ncbi:MAG: hypothetical protein KGO94_06000, partial [Alphaproteobacteria bacterium]|nr:hypothetical protein [Alphaproteobacteria bacterium]
MNKAKGRWQRKLATALSVVPFVWLLATSAPAAITDTVVATGQSQGQTLTSTATVNVTVAPANPGLSFVKTATPHDGGDGSLDVNDTISYSFTLKNTGNVTLTDVMVSDPQVTIVGAAIPSLAPGQSDSTTFSAVHTITTADLIAGSFNNTATAKAKAAAGTNPSVTSTAPTDLTVVSSMTFKKAGVLNMGPDGRADVGDLITYQFTVTNTGPSP